MTMTRKQQCEYIKKAIKALNPSIARICLLDMLEVSKTKAINTLYENVFLYNSYNTYAYASDSYIEVEREMALIKKNFYIIRLSNNIYVGLHASLSIENTINFYKTYRHNPLIERIIKYDTNNKNDVLKINIVI